ncbi:response regulator transcription factor [Segeticoccus rhizosphaerae]|uniref:response regulator transcription factor n=1 Tax=Segeticoccus rhizosphaerae TaxID=1104777 RepID=UPI001EF10D75|nr:response regulator transcription factor [Segeticoccus rhizosphaerae]
MTRVRVVFADDSFLVREGVRRMLDASGDLEVVAACADLDEALDAVAEHLPEVVLTDIRMPPTHTDEGIRVAAHCRRAHPEMGVLLLSQYVEPSYVKVLLEQGTERRGYLLKERIAELDDLTAAIRTVAEGGTAIDPKVVEALVQGRSKVGDSSLARLSRREREVLAAIAQGRTNRAVAADLVLSQHAVEKHINSIFAKLDLSGDQEHHPRVRAALLYLAEGRS